MKKLIEKYRRWRYRRLYRKLFFMYTKKHESAHVACNEAADAFAWLCGVEVK
ncbi:MAG: hypothetical protein ACI30X_07005 [Muribaculaceae bacterium]